MPLKKLSILILCGAAQIGFALPPTSDIGEPLSNTANNTLTTTPVTQNQPLELPSQPMITSGTASLSADILDKMTSLENQVAQLQNQVDVLQHDLQKTQDQLSKTQEQLDKKIAQMVAVPVAPAPVVAKAITPAKATNTTTSITTSSTPTATKTTSPATPVTPEAQEKNTYEAAYSLISAHAYDDASEALSAYLKIYGKDGRYAANASYWLCELNANEQKYPEAVTCFEALIAQYPQSNKVPDALLKLGMVNKRMGDDAKAQSWFNQLIKQYPQSASAQAAKEYV